MAYPTPKEGQQISREVSDTPLRPAGVYRHKETGEEAIVQNDPLYGDAQAAAFERVGFEFVREARPDEIHTILAPNPTDIAGVKSDMSSEDLKGLQARMSMLERENTNNADVHPAAQAGVQSVLSGHAVGDDTGQDADNSEEEVAEKPLAEMKRAELEKVAAAEGIDPTEHDTKIKLADAITAARAEGQDSDEKTESDEKSEDEDKTGNVASPNAIAAERVTVEKENE